jgi:hypothetical protein
VVGECVPTTGNKWLKDVTLVWGKKREMFGFLKKPSFKMSKEAV